MSTIDVHGQSSGNAVAQPGTVEMKLEVVVLPVSDVDRAKRFYQMLGWRLDADFATGEDFRCVQLTPTGSAASIIFGTGITNATPGSADSLILVVHDIDAARADFAARAHDLQRGMQRFRVIYRAILWHQNPGRVRREGWRRLFAGTSVDHKDRDDAMGKHRLGDTAE